MTSSDEKQIVAAIVPAYNEQETIGPVVRVLVASPLVQEVIVISDGSTDRTAEVAKTAGADLVRQLPIKSGKGAAMLHGVTVTRAPVIVFFDADLRGLTEDHVERLLLPVLSGSRAMNVGLRDKGPLLTRFIRYLPLIGGERAMHREVIERVPPQFLQGFMVESALNYYCRSRRLRYGGVKLEGLSMRRKFEKVGVARSVREYLHMTWQIVKAMLIVRIARLFKRF